MIKYLLRHKDLFRSVVGISFEEFMTLSARFEHFVSRVEMNRVREMERLRKPGAGRKSSLRDHKAQLFFILFYYKIYPTFRLAQVIFKLDKANIHRWVDKLGPILEMTGSYLFKDKKKRRGRISSLDELFEEIPELEEIIVDATEREINRPKKNQENYYSGKKKKHTLKNQIIVDPHNKKILSVSDTVPGTVHDKKLLEMDGILNHAPPDSVCMGDLGYLGADEINPKIRFITPIKKKRGKDLTSAEKKINKTISSIRVRSEHPFTYPKHFYILKHKFRGRLHRAHQPFISISGVYNFTRDC